MLKHGPHLQRRWSWQLTWRMPGLLAFLKMCGKPTQRGRKQRPLFRSCFGAVSCFRAEVPYLRLPPDVDVQLVATEAEHS